MNVPASFKKALAATFYDKDLQLCEKAVETDALGAVIGAGYTPVLDFKGSFQPNVSSANVTEGGNESVSGFRVACELDPSQVKRLEHVVLYKGVYYEIEGVFPTDTALILNVSEVGK